MFERVHPDFGRPLSWKWGILGFSALPYASIALADVAASLVQAAGAGFGYDDPYSVVSWIRHMGALPAIPLADLSLEVFRITSSWPLAVAASYALLLGGALGATAIVRRVQSPSTSGAADRRRPGRGPDLHDGAAHAAPSRARSDR